MERHPGIRREGFGVKSLQHSNWKEEKQLGRVKWDWVHFSYGKRQEAR